MQNSVPVLALVTDLMFGSKISAEARAAGTPVKILRQPAQLAGLEGRSLILDLNLAGAIPAAAAWGMACGKPVYGYVSHSDQETIALARQAGIQNILARSRFVQLLPELLAPVTE